MQNQNCPYKAHGTYAVWQRIPPVSSELHKLSLWTPSVTLQTTIRQSTSSQSSASMLLATHHSQQPQIRRRGAVRSYGLPTVPTAFYLGIVAIRSASVERQKIVFATRASLADGERSMSPSVIRKNYPRFATSLCMWHPCTMGEYNCNFI
jgi:hypothetical protein